MKKKAFAPPVPPVVLPDLSGLGLVRGYLPGLQLAPPAKAPTFRRAPQPVRRSISTAGFPLDSADDATVQMAMAVLSGMLGSLVGLDHFTRRLADIGQIKHGARQKLNQLVNLVDQVLESTQKEFDMQDGTAAIAFSDILGQGMELLLQLTPAQIKSSLTHMHEMALLNLNYVPNPVPPTENLRQPS